jgi:chitodextrinase
VKKILLALGATTSIVYAQSKQNVNFHTQILAESKVIDAWGGKDAFLAKVKDQFRVVDSALNQQVLLKNTYTHTFDSVSVATVDGCSPLYSKEYAQAQQQIKDNGASSYQLVVLYHGTCKWDYGAGEYGILFGTDDNGKSLFSETQTRIMGHEFSHRLGAMDIYPRVNTAYLDTYSERFTYPYTYMTSQRTLSLMQDYLHWTMDPANAFLINNGGSRTLERVSTSVDAQNRAWPKTLRINVKNGTANLSNLTARIMVKRPVAGEQIANDRDYVLDTLGFVRTTNSSGNIDFNTRVFNQALTSNPFKFSGTSLNRIQNPLIYVEVKHNGKTILQPIPAIDVMSRFGLMNGDTNIQTWNINFQTNIRPKVGCGISEQGNEIVLQCRANDPNAVNPPTVTVRRHDLTSGTTIPLTGKKEGSNNDFRDQKSDKSYYDYTVVVTDDKGLKDSVVYNYRETNLNVAPFSIQATSAPSNAMSIVIDTNLSLGQAGRVISGGNKKLTWSLNSGYRLDSVRLNGVKISNFPLTSNAYTLVNVKSNQQVVFHASPVVATKPVIAINNPYEGQVIYQYPSDVQGLNLTASINAQDGAIDSVQYTIFETLCDGPGCVQERKVGVKQAPYSLNYQPNFNRNGFTQIQAFAFAPGSVSDAAVRSFTVKALPEAKLVAPATGAVLNPGALTLDLDVNTNQTAIDSVVIYAIDLIGQGMGTTTVERKFKTTGASPDLNYTATTGARQTNFNVIAFGPGETYSRTLSTNVQYNTAPAVAITSPASTAKYNVGGSITITANVTDANNNLQQVEIYSPHIPGSNVILTQAPWTATFNNLPSSGQRYSTSFVVRATDALGAVNEASIDIAENRTPTVSLSAPANNASYTAPAAVTLTASAADQDGSVSKVEFYQGTTLLGTATTSPYTYVWSGVSAGTYSLIAKVFDDLGATANSSTVSINVVPGQCNGLPLWNNLSVYTAGSRVQHLGTIYRAQWWTQNENPSTTGQWGVWANEGPCP